MTSQIIKSHQVATQPRDGYEHQRYVAHDDETPYNFLYIDVWGRHGTRRVVAGIRNYHVLAGAGVFELNGEVYSVGPKDLIIIRPGDTYAYEGDMLLTEFNIDEGDGIAHEDLE